MYDDEDDWYREPDTDFFIIDRSSGQIVNCITSIRGIPKLPGHYPGTQYVLKPSSQVSLSVKQNYRYWNERP